MRIRQGKCVDAVDAARVIAAATSGGIVAYHGVPGVDPVRAVEDVDVVDGGVLSGLEEQEQRLYAQSRAIDDHRRGNGDVAPRRRRRLAQAEGELHLRSPTPMADEQSALQFRHHGVAVGP